MQSNLNNSYQEIREYLINGKQVLFIGTPCQVYGLKNFLLQDYENLITVDLVCKGVASPKFWENYLKNKEKTENSKINHINFRKKIEDIIQPIWKFNSKITLYMLKTKRIIL